MPLAVMTPAMWCQLPSRALVALPVSSTQLLDPLCLATFIWLLLKTRRA